MTTPLDALVAALHDAAGYNAAAEAPPSTVVWCDANSDFLPLLPALRQRLPELLTYGDLDMSIRTGPAVWLRAAVVGAIEGVSIPEEATPIIYVPGVGRETLRGAEDCPALLQPLVWFAVAGSFFGHVNGKDWTLRGFLAAERGALKLTIPDDGATRAALAHAAQRFCSRPIEELRGKRWDADQLNALLAPDLVADMLDWLNGTFSEEADPGRFAAFANLATKDLKFDPRKLTRDDAVARLSKREGRWADVWTRFYNSSDYNGVVQLLEQQEPYNLLDRAENRDAYPKLNARGEETLRSALSGLAEMSAAEAAGKLAALDQEHAWRRNTVWARRGQAPLAEGLLYLAAVAKARPLPSHDGEALAEAYADTGAEVDRLAMRALAAVTRSVDRDAVSAALRAVYLPWLEEGALALQGLVHTGNVKLSTGGSNPNPGSTILFVDGFRMDLALDLVRFLEAEGATVERGWMWSGFPTVTATCKPMVSPVAPLLSGPETTSDVLPVAADGKSATKAVLYKLMQAEGWETENLLLPSGKLWAEAGSFDEDGHALGARLAEQLARGIRDVADRVLQLVRLGRSVRLVTDHGWLLMPGGLPPATLDVGLVEPNGKRTRCALVKPHAQTSYLQIPWSWNSDVLVATATGARSFFGGYEYAHGGVSPQECILPVLDISGDVVKRSVSIDRAEWQGLRLRVEVGGGADLRVDLRLGPETSGTTLIKGGRVLDENGRTSFLVGDQHEGQAASLVLLDDDGRVIAHRPLTVGGQ